MGVYGFFATLPLDAKHAKAKWKEFHENCPFKFRFVGYNSISTLTENLKS